MKAGETYTVPVHGEHQGHTVTVVAVHHHPPSNGPDVDPGGPDTVDVACSCGSRWTFEDRDDGTDR